MKTVDITIEDDYTRLVLKHYRIEIMNAPVSIDWNNGRWIVITLIGSHTTVLADFEFHAEAKEWIENTLGKHVA